MSGFDSSKKYVEYCSRVNQYLEEYFNIWSESRTTTSDMISIDDDGLVSVEGNVGLKPKFDKITLPVRFKKTHTFSIHANRSLRQICHLNYQTMSVLDRGEFNSELSVLLTRYLNSGSKGVLALASELISLGYERQARL